METNRLLKEKVENNLDSNIINNNISINVFGKEVTITGFAKSYYEKDIIGQIAWSTFGVVAVNNELAIDNKN